MSIPSSQNPEHSRNREFSVILEDLRSQFQVFGEGLVFLTEKVEKMDTRLDTMESRLNTIDARLQHIDSRLTNVEKRLTNVEKTLPTLATKTDFECMFNTLSDHETRLTILEK